MTKSTRQEAIDAAVQQAYKRWPEPMRKMVRNSNYWATYAVEYIRVVFAKLREEKPSEFRAATSAELFAEFGSKDPEKDERELNAVIRRMDIKENNT